MANVVNLMPGTLVAEINDDGLQVHVLDESVAVVLELGRLEKLTAAIFKAGGSV